MNTKDQNYISPAMEVMNFEVEQAILITSTEELGTRYEDQEW